MGLVVFGAMALYLIVSIAVVAFAARAAKRNGKRPWRWGGGAALVMYLLVFWDHIPTIVAHKLNCDKEAGFWIYKSPDAWKVDNPGVMETLTTPKIWQHDFSGGGGVVHINQRFDLIYKKEKLLFLHQWRWQRELVDIKNSEVLARYVDFSTGNGLIGGEPEFRFWLHRDGCMDGKDNAIKFGQLTIQVKGKEK